MSSFGTQRPRAIGGVDRPRRYIVEPCCRFADDFVVLCPTQEKAKEALALVEQVLNGGLGLQLSREKTKVTSFGKGYAFLGFTLSSRSRLMRPKSVKQFKDKIRELTRRKYNLDAAGLFNSTE